MTAIELLSELQSRGVEFQIWGDKLRYAPARAVTPELRQALAEHKPEIMALLGQHCPTCRERLVIEENDRYQAVQCPTRPVHYFRVENKRPGRAMGFFLDPDDPLSEALAYTDGVPYWNEMVEYLSLPHDDRFGLQEKARLDSAWAALERAWERARERPGDPKAKAQLEAATKQYKTAVDAVTALFKRTYPAMFKAM